MNPVRVVVVGNGMVSHRLCEKLVDYDRDRRMRVVVVGEEPRPAYDRVHLTEYFSTRSADALALGTRRLVREPRHRAPHRDARHPRRPRAPAGDDRRPATTIDYDYLVLATGSAPFVPDVPGIRQEGRLRLPHHRGSRRDPRARRRGATARGHRRRPPRPRGRARGARRRPGDPRRRGRPAPHAAPARPRGRRAAGADGARPRRARARRPEHRAAPRGRHRHGHRVRRTATAVEADLVIVSAGIRPRDELARAAGLGVGAARRNRRRRRPPHERPARLRHRRGGAPRRDDPRPRRPRLRDGRRRRPEPHRRRRRVSAAATVRRASSSSAPTSPRSATRSRIRSARRVIAREDQIRGTYKKLVFGDEGRQPPRRHPRRRRLELRQAPSPHALQDRPLRDPRRARTRRRQAAGEPRARGPTTRRSAPATTSPPAPSAPPSAATPGIYPRADQDVHQGRHRMRRVPALGHRRPPGRAHAPADSAVKPPLCEHFAFTRQELFEIVVGDAASAPSRDLIAEHGTGIGCEICKPTVASILASLHGEPILGQAAPHAAGHERSLPRQHPEERHLLGHPARARGRDHRRQAHRPRRGRQEATTST